MSKFKVKKRKDSYKHKSDQKGLVQGYKIKRDKDYDADEYRSKRNVKSKENYTSIKNPFNKKKNLVSVYRKKATTTELNKQTNSKPNKTKTKRLTVEIGNKKVIDKTKIKFPHGKKKKKKK